MRFYLSIEEANATPPETFLDELKTIARREKWIDRLESLGYRIDPPAIVSKGKGTPRSMPLRHSERDKQFVKWADAGENSYAIARKWNEKTGSNISRDAVTKATQRARMNKSGQMWTRVSDVHIWRRTSDSF